MKRIIFAALLLAISAPALAAPPELPPLDIEETFFSPETGGKTITLSKDERDSLALIQKWKSGQSVAPTQATDGTILYRLERSPFTQMARLLPYRLSQELPSIFSAFPGYDAAYA